MSTWGLQKNCLGEIARSDRCFGKRDVKLYYICQWLAKRRLNVDMLCV